MYKRLINEDDNEDHSANDQYSHELTKLNRRNLYNDIYHTIKPNETLQGIALRYSCSTSRLRLHNGLMSDQEFYRLKVIKIPVFILRCDNGNLDSETQNEPQVVNNLIDVSSKDGDDSTTQTTDIINIGISNYLDKNGGEDYHKFLNALSTDLNKLRQITSTQIENSPILNVITNESDKQFEKSHSYITCDGSDYGIKWCYLIITLVFVCLLVPTYVLYNLEHHNSTIRHKD